MSKFGYAFKTSDGIRHTDTMEAKNRERVFEMLRQRGIRPIKVWEEEKPPLIRALRKAVMILVLVAAALLLVYLGMTVGIRKPAAPGPSTSLTESSTVNAPPGAKTGAGPIETRIVSLVEPSIRRYIDGLVLDEKALNTIFDRPSYRYLALYSQPGERIVPPTMTEALKRDFLEGMRERVLAYAEDDRAVRDLKGVVAGMKEEMERFMKLGGSIDDYFTMLESRQNAECDYKDKTYRTYRERGAGLSPSERLALRNSLNATLKAMGIRPIPDK